MEPDKPHPPCVKYCIFSAVFFFFPNGDFHVIYPPLVWCLASQQLADLDRYTCSIAYKLPWKHSAYKAWISPLIVRWVVNI